MNKYDISSKTIKIYSKDIFIARKTNFSFLDLPWKRLDKFHEIKTICIEETNKELKEQKNYFKDLYDNGAKKGILNLAYEIEGVDDDWLRGYFYMHNLFCERGGNVCNKMNNFLIFFIGLNPNIIKGLNYYNTKSTNSEKIKYKHKIISLVNSNSSKGYHKKYHKLNLQNYLEEEKFLFKKNKFLDGHLDNGDIYDQSNITHMSIYMPIRTDLIFSDIFPESSNLAIRTGLSTLLIGYNKLSTNGTLILRLPYPNKWNYNLASFYILISFLFKFTSIEDSNWGKRKIYLLCKNKKFKKLPHKKKLSFFYSNFPYENTLLLNPELFLISVNSFGIVENNPFYNQLEKLKNIEKDMSKFSLNIEKDFDVSSYWLKLINNTMK